MTNREKFFRWYTANQDILKGFKQTEVADLFNRDNPGLLSRKTGCEYLRDIISGKTTDLTFSKLSVQTFASEVKIPVKEIYTPFARPTEKPFKVLIFSDTHGWLADLKALRCINKVLQRNKFDEVCINGDLVDLPYLSKHTQRLFPDGILKEYTEIGEFEYTRDQILKPLRNSTDAKIRVRLGNHDERVTKPNFLSDKQLQRLAVLYKHYQTTKYDEMLGLSSEDGYIYDPSDVFTYFDKFDVVHGLSLTKNAPEKNIQEYMSSGTSGHTHRLHAYPKTNKKNPYVWLESGCTRLTEQVEYLPTGKIADWQQGFVCVTFVRRDGDMYFHWECVQIINGHCMYNGEFFSG